MPNSEVAAFSTAAATMVVEVDVTVVVAAASPKTVRTISAALGTVASWAAVTVLLRKVVEPKTVSA
jgi:hypothetical protein